MHSLSSARREVLQTQKFSKTEYRLSLPNKTVLQQVRSVVLWENDAWISKNIYTKQILYSNFIVPQAF